MTAIHRYLATSCYNNKRSWMQPDATGIKARMTMNQRHNCSIWDKLYIVVKYSYFKKRLVLLYKFLHKRPRTMFILTTNVINVKVCLLVCYALITYPYLLRCVVVGINDIVYLKVPFIPKGTAREDPWTKTNIIVKVSFSNVAVYALFFRPTTMKLLDQQTAMQ